MALRIQPLQAMKTADSGRTISVAVSSSVLRPRTPRIKPLRATNAVSPPIHRSPLSVLRTLRGLSSQACSNIRCTARVKLSTAIMRKKMPARPRLVLSPEAGANIASTASAPPPVSS